MNRNRLENAILDMNSSRVSVSVINGFRAILEDEPVSNYGFFIKEEEIFMPRKKKEEIRPQAGELWSQGGSNCYIKKFNSVLKRVWPNGMEHDIEDDKMRHDNDNWVRVYPPVKEGE